MALLNEQSFVTTPMIQQCLVVQRGPVLKLATTGTYQERTESVECVRWGK